MAVAVGVITILGYIIAFGGIYIFVGSYIAQNVFGNPHFWGLTQIITIAYGVWLWWRPWCPQEPLGVGRRRPGSRPAAGSRLADPKDRPPRHAARAANPSR